MLHILVGDADQDTKTILDSDKIGKSVEWFVPKNAHVGDPVLFYLSSLGFTASGAIATQPRQEESKLGWYRAAVRDLELLQNAVPLEFIRNNHPKWRWATYPRSYTTISGAIEAQLAELLKIYKPLPSGVSKQTSLPRVLFARVGWMKWYRGPQTDDQKPVGGGKYTTRSLGHEAFNFFPINNKVYGYFQPQLQPKKRRKQHPSSIRLERIEPGFHGNKLTSVLVIFVAKDPTAGRQKIAGWFKNAIVHRYAQRSDFKERQRFSFFIESDAGNAHLVPTAGRSFEIPAGGGGIGQANVCYAFGSNGQFKGASKWIDEAVEYVTFYEKDDAVQQPESEADAEIDDIVSSALERSAGFQSNSRIRRAIEEYAMNWAKKRLTELGLEPIDKHKTKPYDFLCTAGGAELFVEVKGTQESGKAIFLTPREVKHARDHKNSALFVVHSVRVRGKSKPKVSAGAEIFISRWDIAAGRLEPRGFVFTLPESALKLTRRAGAPSS